MPCGCAGRTHRLCSYGAGRIHRLYSYGAGRIHRLCSYGAGRIHLKLYSHPQPSRLAGSFDICFLNLKLGLEPDFNHEANTAH